MQNNHNESVEELNQSNNNSITDCKCLYEVINVNPDLLPVNGPIDEETFESLIINSIRKVQRIITQENDPSPTRLQASELITTVVDHIGRIDKEQYYRENGRLLARSHNCRLFKHSGLAVLYDVLRENNEIMAQEREKRIRKPNRRYANNDYDTTTGNEDATQQTQPAHQQREDPANKQIINTENVMATIMDNSTNQPISLIKETTTANKEPAAKKPTNKGKQTTKAPSTRKETTSQAGKHSNTGSNANRNKPTTGQKQTKRNTQKQAGTVMITGLEPADYRIVTSIANKDITHSMNRPSTTPSTTTKKQTRGRQTKAQQTTKSPTTGQHQAYKNPTTTRQQNDNSPRTEQQQEKNNPITEQQQEKNSPITEQQQENNSPITEQQQENNNPITEQQQENNNPSTEQQQKNNNPITEQQQKDNNPISSTKQTNNNSATTKKQNDNLTAEDENNKTQQKEKERRTTKEIVILSSPSISSSDLSFTSTEASQPSSTPLSPTSRSDKEKSAPPNKPTTPTSPKQTRKQAKSTSSIASKDTETYSYKSRTTATTSQQRPTAGPSHEHEHQDLESLKQQLATKENEYERFSDLILAGKISIFNPINEKLITQLDAQISKLKDKIQEEESIITGNTSLKQWQPSLAAYKDTTPKLHTPRANIITKKRRASVSPKTIKQSKRRKRHMGWMTSADGVIADGYTNVKKVADHDKENGWEALIVIFEGSKEEKRDDGMYKMHPREALKFGWGHIKRYLNALTPPRIRNLKEHYKQLYLIYKAANEQELDRDKLDQAAREADEKHKIWKEKHYKRMRDRRQPKDKEDQGPKDKDKQ